MKQNSNTFLLIFTFLNVIIGIRAQDQQDAFDKTSNVAVKRFVMSRVKSIKKDELVEQKKTIMQRM